MPWHSEEVVFFGFEEGGGGGGGGGVHKFEVISCMLLPSLEFKSVQRKFGDSGKVINGPFQERRRKLD